MWMCSFFTAPVAAFMIAHVMAQDEGTPVRMVTVDLPHLLNRTSDTDPTGYIPDLWDALDNTKLITLKYPIRVASNFGQAVRDILNGNSDVFLAFVEPTAELNKSMTFTIPVMNTSNVLVYHKDLNSTDTLLYLNGTDAKDIMERHTNVFTPTMRQLSQAVPSVPAGLEAVNNKKAFFLGRYPFFNKVMKKYPNLRITKKLETVITHFGVAKNKPEILESLNAALYMLKRAGTLENLRILHFEGVERALNKLNTKPKA
ncbi:uncharacterized protein LOC129590174 [Paramacrobiotus metropolitanus]|uniref:uncharacterized protein LOC129590174 n=1 Tax=Paramacrobiotus metropolitanus TaxID=2943436 RepID=UPI00244605DB|nr:uncharacterized protein LOC129590174 [Paramacrobiotus metropolitanus]